MVKTLLAKYKLRLILAVIISGISGAIGMGLLAWISEEVSSPVAEGIGVRAGFFAVAVLAMFVIGFFSQQLLTHLSSSIVKELRSVMLSRVLNTRYVQLEKIGGHRVHATLTNDVNYLSGALSALPSFSFDLVMVILCFGYLAYQSWEYFLITVGVFLIGGLVAKVIISKGTAGFQLLREQEDSLFKTFKALVDGSKELSVNDKRKQHFYHHEAAPSLDTIKHSEIKANMFWNLSVSWTNVILFSLLGVLVFSVRMFATVDTSVLVSYAIVAIYMVGPVTMVMNSFRSITRGLVAYRKISNLQLFEGDDIDMDTVATSASDLSWSQLQVNAVSYKYRTHDDYEFSIGPVDLHINRGEIFFICGGNGSGKSTFAKLLIGLYAPDSGQLTFDKPPLSYTNERLYKSQFSTVFSDFYLFDYVLDAQGNVANDAAILPHLDKLKLSDKVIVKNGKLSTTELSHGQRKRLALLLAYMEDAPIYVFDEWAADQDPYFRDYFYTFLLPELKTKGKTVIVISHDDKYFWVADRIIEFDQGQATSREVPKAPAHSESRLIGQ